MVTTKLRVFFQISKFALFWSAFRYFRIHSAGVFHVNIDKNSVILSASATYFSQIRRFDDSMSWTISMVSRNRPSLGYPDWKIVIFQSSSPTRDSGTKRADIIKHIDHVLNLTISKYFKFKYFLIARYTICWFSYCLSCFFPKNVAFIKSIHCSFCKVLTDCYGNGILVLYSKQSKLVHIPS